MRKPTVVFLLILSVLTGAAAIPAVAPAAGLPPIGHVWVIVLENEDQATSFGPSSQAPYLARTLPAQGAFVPNYYGIGHASLDNYIAMISGQGPNPITQSDCQFYQDLAPGTIGADGQAQGAGCVYPAAVQTVSDQLAARGLAWRGYMEDIGNSTTQPTTCRHPDLNSQDSTQSAHKGDQYAARHDPFVYFHSIIDSVSCFTNVVGTDRLAQDLGSPATTPSLSFITPNLCHDGHDSPCVDGQPGGLVSADQFLKTWIPQITASAAYQADGLVAVIFDEAAHDSSACCGEVAAGTPSAGGQTPGPGGGKVGAVLLSPYIRPGTVTQTAYNHYSLLRSIEDVFALPHLGYAARDGLTPFGADIFTGSAQTLPGAVAPAVASCTSTTLGARAHGRARRGALIHAVLVLRRPAGGTPLLAVETAHATRLRVVVTVSGGRRRTLRDRRARACHRYLIALPSQHGQASVTATTVHVRERRAVRF